MNETRIEGTEQVRENIGTHLAKISVDCLYSTKGHYAAAERWRNYYWVLSGITIILSAITTAATTYDWKTTGMIAGTLTFLVSGINTMLKPGQKQQQHFYAAGQYNQLKDEISAYRLSKLIFQSVDDFSNDYEKFIERKSALNQESPQIPTFAYQKAKKGMAAGEAKYTKTELESVSYEQH